jgi:hypothetical protein
VPTRQLRINASKEISDKTKSIYGKRQTRPINDSQNIQAPFAKERNYISFTFMSDPWLHITFFVKKSSFAPSSLSPV